MLERVNDLANHALLAYITSRGISENVAKHNCKQVHYSTSDKYYYAIGFANNSGGWELRNPYFKGSSSPKDITTILKGSNEVAIFEGFMDFLSYLTIKGKQDSMSDIVVMNSLRLIDRVLPFLKNYDVIRTYLDNDDAGRKSTEELFSKSATSKILDCSSTYSKFKDLNDYLQSTMQEKNQYRGNFKIRH